MLSHPPTKAEQERWLLRRLRDGPCDDTDLLAMLQKQSGAVTVVVGSAFEGTALTIAICRLNPWMSRASTSVNMRLRCSSQRLRCAAALVPDSRT
jgi:hypothetical protein